MHHRQLRELLRRYADDACTENERKKLEDLILRHPMVSDWVWSSDEERLLTGIRIKKSIDEVRLAKKNRIRRWWYVSAAASLVLVAGIAGFLRHTPKVGIAEDQVVINESVVAPQEGIILTLSDGSAVQLDDSTALTASMPGKPASWKLQNGQLVYDAAQRQAAQPVYNTIQLPNGKQFKITLSDGTQVWLNTASSLTYPVAFSGPERKVTLVGEAYFEVAHDKATPFIVEAQGTEVEVTGTHFNVSAYASDRTVTTTLLEGGVVVRKEGQAVSLTPGFQAVTHSDNLSIDKHPGHTEQTLAWKNGYFMFDDMDIVSVMRSVSRWYDIQVMIAGEIPAKRFGGTFPISGDLEELLQDLSSLGGMTFKRNGREVWIIW